MSETVCVGGGIPADAANERSQNPSGYSVSVTKMNEFAKELLLEITLPLGAI